MAKKSSFGNYKMIGSVFGGKPSARSRKAKKDDFLQLGGVTLPAMLLVGYLLYKRGNKPDPNAVATLSDKEKLVIKGINGQTPKRDSKMNWFINLSPEEKKKWREILLARRRRRQA